LRRAASIWLQLEARRIHDNNAAETKIDSINKASACTNATVSASTARPAIWTYPTLAEAYKIAGLDGWNR